MASDWTEEMEDASREVLHKGSSMMCTYPSLIRVLPGVDVWWARLLVGMWAGDIILHGTFFMLNAHIQK